MGEARKISPAVMNQGVNEFRCRAIRALRDVSEMESDGEFRDRVQTAIRSLAMAMVEDIEACYVPKRFKVTATLEKHIEADSQLDAELKVTDMLHRNDADMKDVKAEEEQ